jgi:hypothetical protein
MWSPSAVTPALWSRWQGLTLADAL